MVGDSIDLAGSHLGLEGGEVGRSRETGGMPAAGVVVVAWDVT